MPSDPELAVVAHGLVNVIAIISGSASTVARFEPRLDDAKLRGLLDDLTATVGALDQGVSVLRDHCSNAFVTSALALVAAVRRVVRLPRHELVAALEDVLERSSDVASHLHSMEAEWRSNFSR